jgi:hypothetical protein
MIVTILYRIEKGNQGEEVDAAFNDVAKGTWYYEAVLWAAGNGIVKGYGDGKFGPTDNVTREQLATILYRYARWKAIDSSETADLGAFSDAGTISSWALDAITWANANGLITGRTETELAPKGTATRAEAATILQRLVSNLLTPSISAD